MAWCAAAAPTVTWKKLSSTHCCTRSTAPTVVRSKTSKFPLSKSRGFESSVSVGERRRGHGRPSVASNGNRINPQHHGTHVVDGWKVIRRLTPHVKPDGRVLAAGLYLCESEPNAQDYKKSGVRPAPIQDSSGVLDRVHALCSQGTHKVITSHVTAQAYTLTASCRQEPYSVARRLRALHIRRI